MIGLKRNKRGDMVLTIDSYVDIDSTPDIQSDYFDCIYINTKSERAFHAILLGASPILSYKCSYKPIFVNMALSGKEQITDYIIDAYVSDMSNEKVYEIIDKIKAAKEKYGIKQEVVRPTQPNQLFTNILRYLLSRDQRIVTHRLMEKSSLGYINPIFEHYHSISLFHLAEMFSFIDTLEEYGALRKHKYLIKEHLCPKCNHSHLLYTECCPKCGSSNLKIQNIIHHFSCANVAPESAYNVGGMLICPKCHKRLRHIGVDYDRPAVIYSCNDCENSFTTPITKSTCCYCESTFPVNALVPRDVEDYEITDEGIRALTQSGMLFSNMTNTYDNYMEYSLLQNRLRRQLLETYRDDQISVIVGKIWILNPKQETIKIKDAIQAKFCRLFNSHKVSYNNNIFYVTYAAFDEKSEMEAQQHLSKEMSKAIRKVSNMIEPDDIICCVLNTKHKGMSGQYDDFFDKMNFIELTPDDYCTYSKNPITDEETVKQQKERLDIAPEEDETDKALKRVKLYKDLVGILVAIAGILVLIVILALTILR